MKISVNNFGNGYKFKSKRIDEAYKFARDIHEFTELVYIEDGAVRVTVDGESDIVEAGNFVVITPFRQHSYYAQKRCKIWMAVFSADFINDIISENELFRHRKKVYFKPSPEMEIYAKSRMTDYDEFDIAKKDRIRSLKALLHAIFEEYLSKAAEVENDASNSALISILLYVKEHFRENITRQSIANALGYHPMYLSQCINSIPNINLRKLLNSTRVEYAKGLLTKTNLRIIDIALECGFSGERSFYRAFNEILKLSPGEYRRKYKI